MRRDEERHPAALLAQNCVRLSRRHRDAAADKSAGLRRAHAREFVAEARRVERQRIHRAVAGLRAGQRRVVVGIIRHRAIPQAGLLFEVTHHARRVLEVSEQARLGDHPARRGLEISERIVVAVVGSCSGQQMIAWHPYAAARDRAGAAVLVALFDDDDRLAEIVRGDRGGQAAGARADDDHVELVIPMRVGGRRAESHAAAHMKKSVLPSPSRTPP